MATRNIATTNAYSHIAPHPASHITYPPQCSLPSGRDRTTAPSYPTPHYPLPQAGPESTSRSVFSNDSEDEEEDVTEATNKRSSLLLDLRELRRVDSRVMERRELRRQKSKTTLPHHPTFQVIKVRSHGINPDPRLPEWQVAERPKEALNIGDSIFVQLADDERQQGYAAPFMIVDSPTFPQEGVVRLKVMSWAGVHAPIKLTIHTQWFAPTRRPRATEKIWKTFIGCLYGLA
ncbi:hypothetical protein BDY19DRAFT_990941 [Irpex rosettiformis]|uniref:Uncharacterized protein n=1 Tax=Irpex rosettiformis TaxID=378272 RepID=A0ACB8UD66_9APHY|nr:hypothetical protein BDY19DRAFT_990941 [Irpex rosettiformis]